jgi:hypothetical protein
MNKNLLDLRKKGIEKVKVIEHIIFKPRSFKYEMIKMFAVIFTVTAIGFGVSNADNIPVLNKFVENNQNTQEEPPKIFSTFGLVLGIEGNTISIQRIYNSKLQKETYYVETGNAKIQTNQYQDVELLTIAVGTKIIAKGRLEGDTIYARSIFVFNYEPELILQTEEVEDENATSTEDTLLDTASSTNDIDIETGTTTNDTATSTDDTATKKTIIDTTIEIVDKVIDSVIDTTIKVIDTVTGKNKSTTTPEIIIEEEVIEEEQQQIENIKETEVSEPAPEPTLETSE